MGRYHLLANRYLPSWAIVHHSAVFSLRRTWWILIGVVDLERLGRRNHATYNKDRRRMYARNGASLSCLTTDSRNKDQNLPDHCQIQSWRSFESAELLLENLIMIMVLLCALWWMIVLSVQLKMSMEIRTPGVTAYHRSTAYLMPMSIREINLSCNQRTLT